MPPIPRRRLAFGTLLFVLACSRAGEEDGPIPDRDEDGFPWRADCDDADAEVNPQAVERCDGIDNNCDGLVDDDLSVDAVQSYLDADGDGYGSPISARLSCVIPAGYVAVGGDCDDSSRFTFPGAEERCDGKDDDCDGLVDEDATDTGTFYLDADGDGVGDPTEVVVACALPGGYTFTGDDCDDGDFWVRPGRPDVCNDVDDDCDGEVDEDFLRQWLVDLDGDGFTSRQLPVVMACDKPDGFADPLIGKDCNDEDPTIYPGAPEVYYDGIDEDCSLGNDFDADGDGYTSVDWGGRDCNDADRTIVPVEWYLDLDGDGFGGGDFVFACQAPGASYLSLSGDCEDSDPTVNPLAVEVCGDGVDNDCDERPDGCGLEGYLEADVDATHVFSGELSGDLSGSALSFVGDVDGDGLDDLLIGAPGGDLGAVDGGAAYLLCGPAEGRSLLSAATARLYSSTAGALAGVGVAPAGDEDGDGYDDLLVGASAWQDGGGAMGAAWLVHGPLPGDLLLDDEPDRVDGILAGDLAGATLAGGADTDGDGQGDVAIGAPGADGLAADDGVVWLYTSGWSGVVDGGDAVASIHGDAAGDAAGAAIALVADMDGDGLDELAIGDPTTSAGGTVGVFWGPVSGSLAVASADLLILGSSAGQELGRSLAGAGDTDGDGLGDLVLGAPRYDSGGVTYGVAWLFRGPAEGAHVAEEADGAVLGRATSAEYDFIGQAVAAAGDVDASGTGDVLIGSPGASLAGAILVLGPWAGIYTPSDCSAAINAHRRSEGFGSALAGGGDLDGDGFDDIAVGAPTAAGSSTEMGASYVFLSGVGM